MTTTINESEPAEGEAGGVAMPPGRPQFLEGKLNIPEPHFPVLRRRRVTSLIDHATRNRVTLISGPAGAGKTVACASWARANTQARRLVWLTADSDDQQGWFWSYVCAGLRRLRAIPPELLRSLENSSPDRFPLCLVETAQAFTEPVTLVLDDVHELTDQAVLAGLDVLTRHAPPTLRLVLLARQPPALQLARLRVSGDLADIGSQDLACTSEEADAYFALLGLDVDTPARDQLLRRTQGWMAGLRLAALRADADPQPGAAITDLAGDEPIVTDYLWDEVLGKQLPATRMFLLRTSITSEVTGELADALTGQSGSARTLERLSRENSFVEVTDRERGGYVYHPLLREVLAAELHREIPHEIPVLLRRAARWYAANDQPIASVRSAAEAQDWDYAAQILAEAGAGLAAPGLTAELESVLGLFPPDRSADDPAVAAAWAAARLWDGDEEGAAGYLESGERALGRAAPAMRRMMEPVLAALRVMLAGCRTDPDPGLLAEATEIAARAEAAASTQPEHRAAGLTWFAVGVARLRRWEIQQARHALRHADRQLAAGSLAALQARARAWRALAEAWFGDLTAARRSASDVPGVPSGLPPGGRSAAAPGPGPMPRGVLAGGSAPPGGSLAGGPAQGSAARPGSARGPAAGSPAGGGPGRGRLAGDRAGLPGLGGRSAGIGMPGTSGVPDLAGRPGMRPAAGAPRSVRAADGLAGAGLAGAGLAGAGLAGAGLAGAGLAGAGLAGTGQAAEVAVLARALVSLRRDELSAAQRLVEIVSQEAAGQFPGEPPVSAVAALIRARVLLADGDATAATAVLSRLRETWGPTCPALADVVTVAEGEVALRVGNTGRARAVLLLVEESEHFDRADAWLLRGGLLIADGDFKAALEAVAPGLDGPQDQVTLHERISGLLVAAVAHRRLGSTEEAATLLEQALALAEPDGAYRAFLDGGAAVRSAMTVLIPPTSRHAGFAGRILERFDAQTPRGGPAVERISVPLTDSERAVLCFLPSHMTNEEISQALFLSINTVKTHLRSAYRKLGVSSRREAIARGRRLGLLSAGTLARDERRRHLAGGGRGGSGRAGGSDGGGQGAGGPADLTGHQGHDQPVHDQPDADHDDQDGQRDRRPEHHDQPGGQAEHAGDRAQPAAGPRAGRDRHDQVDQPVQRPEHADDEGEQHHGDRDVPQAIQPGQRGQQADDDVSGPGAGTDPGLGEAVDQPDDAGDQQGRADQRGHHDQCGLGPDQQDQPEREGGHRGHHDHLPGLRPGGRGRIGWPVGGGPVHRRAARWRSPGPSRLSGMLGCHHPPPHPGHGVTPRPPVTTHMLGRAVAGSTTRHG